MTDSRVPGEIYRTGDELYKDIAVAIENGNLKIWLLGGEGTELDANKTRILGLKLIEIAFRLDHAP
jgi:hypothetical protein